MRDAHTWLQQETTDVSQKVSGSPHRPDHVANLRKDLCHGWISGRKTYKIEAPREGLLVVAILSFNMVLNVMIIVHSKRLIDFKEVV